MKNHFLLIMVLLLVSYHNIAEAKTYFVKKSGNDNQDGLSEQRAWASLDKVNSMMGSFMPGDKILFNRGDKFYGSLKIAASGTPDNYIFFNAFGRGEIPIIKGSKPVTSWTKYKDKIWVSDLSGLSIENLLDLYLKGIPQDIGRTPNYNDKDGGFRIIQDHVEKNTIVSKELLTDPNWEGAMVILKPNAWAFEKRTILKHSGDKIEFGEVQAGLKNKFGYFIQNSVLTLDVEGEWYLDKDAKKIYLFKEKQPLDEEVEVSQAGDLIVINGVRNIEVANLNVTNSNGYGAIIDTASANIVVKDCSFEKLFMNAVRVAGNSENIKILNNKMFDICNGAIFCTESKNIEIVDNQIKNVSLRTGMMGESNIRAVGCQKY